ncbi:MAG: DUF928 domain-containing protein [Leptolyngbyaceae cyanobacterium]
MRSHNLLASVSLTAAVLLSQGSLIPLAWAAPNQINNTSKQLPPVPSTPQPPSGRRTPGGGLEPSVCPVTDHKLTAITPSDVHGKTLSEHPTFWFYMPYTADDIEGGKFSVLTEDEFQTVYETSFKLPEQPGLISITLPESEVPALEVGEYYHWYLSLDCTIDAQTKTDATIDGWVQRIDPDETTAAQASPEIWYDSLHVAAEQLQNDAIEPGPAWIDLLESVELDALIQAPVVGPVALIDC